MGYTRHTCLPCLITHKNDEKTRQLQAKKQVFHRKQGFQMTQFSPYTSQSTHFTFFKYCKTCGKRFKPTGKGSKLCEKCYENAKCKRGNRK